MTTATLNPNQKEKALLVWQKYITEGQNYVNASDKFTDEELDQRRRQVIPDMLGWLNRFWSGEVPLEEFKTAVDGINKRNRLWGFRAINGQMFFNMLTKNSLAGNWLDDLTVMLKHTLPCPARTEEISEWIDKFAHFTREIGKHSQDLRAAPKVGSIPYFLSYFWQVQEPVKFPIYYTSMVTVLVDLDIWTPAGNVAADYLSFYLLNHELRELFSRQAGKALHLWDVEHAFWFHSQMDLQKEVQAAAAPPVIKSKDEASVVVLVNDLPESYLPPVVSILPRLAVNDPELEAICRRKGTAIEKVFEDRLAILFRMLGYEVESLGQGRGRVPDGIAVSREFRYAIIYDAKVRQQLYTMGTDERAIKEYISVAGDRLRRQGIRNVYFMVISSSFTGDHDDVIRGMKIDTDVREVLLVEANALLALLDGRRRNPDLDLGPDGVQRLLADSGLLTDADIREFLGLA
jgi:hypothetical protein